jgi:hypothetical protein
MEGAFCVSGPAGVSLEDLSRQQDVCYQAHHAPAALWDDARRCLLVFWYCEAELLQQATGGSAAWWSIH